MNNSQIKQELRGIRDAIASLEKKVVTSEFSWWIPWLIGFLFTIGTGAYDAVPITGSWWEQARTVIIAFATWPMYLGTRVFPQP